MSGLLGLDNRRLGHKKPCADCPFRKSSARGYLGGYRVETYAKPSEVGIPTSCHRVDFGASDKRTRICAGSAATILADDTVHVLPEYAEAMAGVVQTGDTFESVKQFRDHHEHMNYIFVDEYRKLSGESSES